MTDIWLVIDENQPEYTTKYRLFSTSESARAHAQSVGYQDAFHDYDDQCGMLNQYCCGKVNVGVIRLRCN